MSSDNAILPENHHQPVVEENSAGKIPAVIDVQEPSTDEDLEASKDINIERLYKSVPLSPCLSPQLLKKSN